MLKLLFTSLAILLITHTGKAEKILIVGDSHSCGAFGATLVKELARKGHKIQLFCTVSSSPTHWLNGSNPKNQVCKTLSSENPTPQPCNREGHVPKIENILIEKSYDSVIVALGTNSLHSSTANSTYQELAEKFAHVHSCFWIAPPHLRPDQAKNSSLIASMENNLSSFYTSLEERVFRSCRLINSLKSTDKNAEGGETSDGVHRTSASGKAWALDILSALPF